MAKQPTERPFHDAIQRNRGIVSSSVLLEAEARLYEIENERINDVFANPVRTLRRARVVYTLGFAALVLFVTATVTGILALTGLLAGQFSLIALVALLLVLGAGRLFAGDNAQQYVDDANLLKDER